MIWQDLKEIKTGERDLRKFGLLVGSVFTVLGLLWWIRHKPYFAWSLTPGLALIALGSVWPKSLKYVYIAWMSLAIVLGFIVSNVLLTAFFFLVITPIGLVARLTGKDFLNLKLNRQASTYWIRHAEKPQKTPADYERQF